MTVPAERSRFALALAASEDPAPAPPADQEGAPPALPAPPDLPDEPRSVVPIASKDADPSSPAPSVELSPRGGVDTPSDDTQRQAMLTPAPSDAALHRPVRADPLDPATRHAAQLGPLDLPPPVQNAAPAAMHAAPPATDAPARASLEMLLPDLVRKIAWSGDGRRGSMRLELGAGSLAGGTLVVHADGGRVRVELDAPAGTDVDAWAASLNERLARRGVVVDELVVR
jgi:hypothetical protein